MHVGILLGVVLGTVLLYMDNCEKVFYDDYSRSAARPPTRVVNTKYGSLRGFVRTLPNNSLKPVEVYLGIPYASPPIGALRFMPPVTPAPWKGVRPVQEFGHVCPQKLPDIRNETETLKKMPVGRLVHLRKLLPHLNNQSEDCLYLNVYTPKYGGRSATKVPVLVYIHGESFEWNAGNPYDGSVLSSYGNVVVVTVNFRLGVFGFLPASDGASRGNYGLMDQFAALHWIQENIAEFGGDPKSVTIFGQGHGAACVNFLVLSPMGKGLFHRAIMQSGSALSPWAIARHAPDHAQLLAKALNCPATESATFLECMRHRFVGDILAIDTFSKEFIPSFGPTVDGVLIEDEPLLVLEELLEEDEPYGGFDLIFGITRAESYFYVSAREEQYGMDKDRRDYLLKKLVSMNFNYHLQEIFLTVINEYTDWTRPVQQALNMLDSTLDAIGDAMVVAPVVKTASYLSVGRHKTYIFVFGYQTEEGDFPQRLGCVNGEDLPYVFGAPLISSLAHFTRNYSTAEVNLAEAVMTNWANFARTGDPNSPNQQLDIGIDRSKGRFEKILWPLYENVHQKYLLIGMKPKIRDHYHAHRLSFWLHLFPRIHLSRSGTSHPEHHILKDHDSVPVHNGLLRFNPGGKTNGQKITSKNSTRRPLRATVQPSYDISLYTTTRAGNNLVANVPQKSNFTTAMSITIGIGCSLLILNIITFVGIYYQRQKIKRDAMQTKREYPKDIDSQLWPDTTQQAKQLPLQVTPPSPACQTIHQHQQELALYQPIHHHMTTTFLPSLVPTNNSCMVPFPSQNQNDDLKESNMSETHPLLNQHLSVNSMGKNCCQLPQNSQLLQMNQQQEMKL